MEAFVDGLRRMLWVEQQLEHGVLPLALERAHGVDLRAGIERHLAETKEHALSVRTVLHQLGQTQHAVEEPAFHAELGNDDLALCEALARTEHLEIASYTHLRSIAHALCEEDIAVRLTEVLEQEEYALELVERATAKFLAENVENAPTGA